LRERGVYQIGGIAWTGSGRVQRVEVSADGGKSWVDAVFDAPPQTRALARFSAAWRWRGQPAVLLSRATDEQGATQPTRNDWIARHGPKSFYHYNAIQAWRVSEGGEVQNVYA
jgi:sulfane dehydrogenase subunit SoxC